MKKRFAVLISGYGRGAIEIINDYKSNIIIPQLSLILSSNPDSFCLKVAKENGIKCELVRKNDYPDRIAFEKQIIDVLIRNKIDYIFLAGWRYIFGEEILSKFPNKIVNIHNSLLPSFKGIKAIHQALEYGVKITGITTHFIDSTLDGGKIIGQKHVLIENSDNFEFLDKKILKLGITLTTETINNTFI